MRVPQLNNNTRRRQTKTRQSGWQMRCIWILLLATIHIGNSSAGIANDIPPKKNVHRETIVIVVPEDADSTTLVDFATFKNPDDSGELVAHWKWTSEENKIDHPPLVSIDQQGNTEDDRADRAIRNLFADDNASYKLDPDETEIPSGGEGTIKLSLFNSHRLQPGVYRGSSNFGMQLATKINSASSDPNVRHLSLDITVVKCGRRLHRVNLWNLDPKSPQIAFGLPWRVAVEFDEFNGSNDAMAGSKHESRPLFKLSSFKTQIDLSLTYGSSVPNATSAPIRLARIGLNEQGFEPPRDAPKDLFIWKDVFFDFVALHEELRVNSSNPADHYLYNSRIKVAGSGPKTWNDPVVWLTKRNVSGAGGELSEYVDHDSNASWHRKTIEIGLPALDVVGKITAQVELLQPSSIKDESRSTHQKDVAPGFAIFPQIAVVGDPVQLVAAIPTPQASPTPIKFNFRHESSGNSFDIDLSADAPSTGNGLRCSQMRSNNELCVCTLENGGSWVIVPPVEWKEKFHLHEFRVFAALKSKPLRKLLIFPQGKPAIFNLLLSNAHSEEISNGCFIPDIGKNTITPDPVSLELIPGAVESIKYATLEPIHVPASTEGHLRFKSGGQPLCELFDESHVKVGNDPALGLQVLKSPIAYQLQARFGPPGDKENELPELNTPQPDELKSRDIEFLVPIVVRSEFGNEIAAQLIFRHFTVCVRNDGDYWLHKVLYFSIVGVSGLFLIAIIIAVIRQQLAQRAELLADVEQDSILSGESNSSQSGVHDEPVFPTEATSQTIEPMEPNDDTPGIL